jgi:hypothetical protein
MALSTWPKGECTIRQIISTAAMKIANTTQYMAALFGQVDQPEQLARGTAWMPSSPPVNGACR